MSLYLFASLSALAQTTPDSSTFIDPRDTLRRQLDEERRRLIDPQTGTVPYERLDQARQQVLHPKSQPGSTTNQTGIPGITWQERGPGDFASVRTMLVDPNDPTHKKVWVGLAAGGLWYTNDITNTTPTWTSASDNLAGLMFGTLAADPSNPQIMYAGTGEMNYSYSTGIWKSTDGGVTWNILSSTVPGGNHPSLGRAFDYVNGLVVNANGQVLVGSRYGLLKSTDGGASWQFILAPNQGIGFGTATGSYYNDMVSDLEIAADGLVYVSLASSRVFKSTSAAATSWADITPSGVTGDRTEIAVAQSTSGSGQILYAVSRLYNNVVYGQDVKWFKKSTDAGATWTDVPIPTISTDSHFTFGYGYQYMQLTVSPTDPNILFAGGYGLFRSINGGTTWTELSGSPGRLYNQRAIQFIPGALGVLDASLQGIYWLADGANAVTVSPRAALQTSGIRAGAAYTLSMKSSPGSNYFLASIQPKGIVQMNAAGIETRSNTLWDTRSTNSSFIDGNEPSLQVFANYNDVYSYNGTSYTRLLTTYNSQFAADYDSQSNTLYVYNYENNQHVIRRITGIGTSPVSTSFVLTGSTDQALYMKLNSDRTTLIVGSFGGKVYKITNLAQTSPTVVRIDNGALPVAAVSCIDLGATDNELLVTFSNYGAQSVWYTNDGGNLWQGKDQLNYGLPDMSVWTALFNPQNRQQVLLGTDLGVWTTTNITNTNPDWTVAGGLPLLRVNQLRYRASDGKVAAATVGRGIWTTDAFAIPYTLPTVTLTSVDNRTLCAGSTMAVSFTTSGTFDPSNQFEVWISDALGSFSNQRRIGAGASSPVSVTLPSNSNILPYGTNYLVKVVASSPEIESAASEPLAIGNLNYAYVLDRRNSSGSGQICSGGQATLSIRAQNYSGVSVAVDQYRWTKDGAVISGATNVSYTASLAGVYSASVVQAGCVLVASTYSLGFSSSPGVSLSSTNYDVSQCAGQTVKASALYVGDNPSYQWVKDGTNVPGATTASYDITQTGRYEVVLRDQSCTSTAGTLRYQFGSAVDATIQFSSSADSLVCAGYSTTAYAYLNSSSKFDFVQWYKNGVALSNENNGYYYTQGPGVYSVTARQGNCQTTSNTLTRRAVQYVPVTISSSGSSNLCPGESRTLYAQSATNSSYRWQLNGVDIPGATSSSYAISSSGVYTVRDSLGRSCGAVSDALSFTFNNAIQPKIVAGSDIKALESCNGGYLYDIDWTSGSNKLSGYTYQWQRDGINISTGPALYAGSTGVYTVRVTNGACTGVSRGVFVKVGSMPKPTITGVVRERCANNVVNLYCYVNGNSSYQWKRNSINIPGATLTNLYATESGKYAVVVTDGSCTSESDPIDVKIGEPTAATITGDAVIGAGQTTYLPIVFSGPAPWSVTLSNGQAATAVTQNPYLMPVTPGATTTYTIGKIANACATGTSSGSAVVTVGSGSADVSLDMVVSSRTPRVGQVVSYSLILTNDGPEVANGVQVQSRLPLGVSFLSSESPAITSGSGVVNVAVGTLPVGIPTTFVFQTIISTPGVMLTNAQIIGSQTPDPDSQPNSGVGAGQDDEAQVDLRTTEEGPIMASVNPNPAVLPRVISNQPTASSSAVELSLQMNLNKLLVSVAQQEVVTATLTVRNRSAITATGVVVRVQLPNGAAQVTPGWQVVDTQTINGFLSSIPAGGLATLQLFWRPSADGDLKAQVFDVAEPATGFTPGNGYSQGEKDEAQVRVRSK
ncbi:DUF11 domain-containing protein [Fibrella forsythiae]|uniref:DUF11 domain-containing protein n=1 Tax=Fibrella forsythiae TaxID=2817061 RepID=A0ABS3JQH6_9BACT|nr:DUF11 domain-containing protein [Fibrella forsythiae]MBO0952269.1 DUF11 domain-containing protein [Fibrella forsythiae]